MPLGYNYGMTVKNSMQFLIILVLASFVTASSVASSISHKRSGISAEAVITVDPMLKKINDIRGEAGLPPLVEDRRLSLSAEAKAKDLVDRGYWSHDTPDGQGFFKLVYEHSPDASAVGENLARCYDDPVPAWVASPGHYENMMADWKYWGSGSAADGRCNYIVNHFSK